MKKIFVLPMLMIAGVALAGCNMPGQADPSETDQNEETNQETVSYDQDSWKEIIPESCQAFNDGCNDCVRGEDGEVACTRMYCETYEEPYCTDDENTMTDESLSTEASLYMGLTFEEAQTLAEENGDDIRAVEIDGEAQPVTMDFRPGRLNVVVENDVVVDVKVEGDAGEKYIGLTLEEAQELAQEVDEEFRVVSIDGEGQPITMDLREGRINASVENNIVTETDVE